MAAILLQQATDDACHWCPFDPSACSDIYIYISAEFASQNRYMELAAALVSKGRPPLRPLPCGFGPDQSCLTAEITVTPHCERIRAIFPLSCIYIYTCRNNCYCVAFKQPGGAVHKKPTMSKALRATVAGSPNDALRICNTFNTCNINCDCITACGMSPLDPFGSTCPLNSTPLVGLPVVVDAFMYIYIYI